MGETFEESGDLPEENERRIKQSEAILAMVEEGAGNAEILRAYPSAMNHLPRIDQARQTFLAERYRKTFRELSVTYIWGRTGVGKTRSVMEEYGYENVYRVTNYRNPFDSYDCEPVILFDEFRSSLPISDMLKYLDGYPVALPARYGDKAACFTTVFVVSNIAIEQQYTFVQVAERRLGGRSCGGSSIYTSCNPTAAIRRFKGVGICLKNFPMCSHRNKLPKLSVSVKIQFIGSSAAGLLVVSGLAEKLSFLNRV